MEIWNGKLPRSWHDRVPPGNTRRIAVLRLVSVTAYDRAENLDKNIQTSDLIR